MKTAALEMGKAKKIMLVIIVALIALLIYYSFGNDIIDTPILVSNFDPSRY